MSYSIGNLELRSVSGGRLWIDGGNMFGVVPRALWERTHRPDVMNRILLDTNCLLIRVEGRCVLVDSGYGSKLDEKVRRNYNAEVGDPLLRNLAEAGVAPDEIDAVILTHLHFDHAGGCTRLDGDAGLRPTFHRARHFVQKAEWEDATGDLPELAGSYFSRDFVPLEEAGLVEFVDGDAELFPGVRMRLTGGHTRGHQIVELSGGDEGALYLADLCPYAVHMRAFWCMAYDQFMLDQRRIKPRVLGEAADRDLLVIYDHDPEVRAAYITRDPKREFVVREPVSL